MNPEADINRHKNVNSAFSDFSRFEGPAGERNEAKRRFINGDDNTPGYAYKKLDLFRDDDKVVATKGAVQEAVMELEAARIAAEMAGDQDRADELLLYRRFHDMRLWKIMLVEEARRLHYQETRSSSELETARVRFDELNERIYGPMDQDAYMSMLAEARDRVESFVPTDEMGAEVSGELRALFGEMKLPRHEKAAGGELLTEDEMAQLHDTVMRRYEHVFAAMPDTDDSVYYNAEQCAAILNDALAANGLADSGWACEIEASKSNPVANVPKQRIYLPSNTRRTAAELRRLYVHEAEIHARRGQHGKEAGLKIIEGGTADYADVEEGLGVLMECAVAGNFDNASFERARDRYIVAGLAMGLDSAPRDARETFEIAWRVLAVSASKDGSMPPELITTAKDKAYAHVENAFRGTDFYMKGVVYRKLKVYYEGLLKNAQYFKKNMHNLDAALDAALIGKMNHTDPEEVAIVQRLVAA